MATRLYLSSTGTVAGVTPGFEAWSRTTEGARRAMSPTKDGSAATSATIWANTSPTANQTALCRQFISPPMIAGIAFDTGDTFKCQIRCKESATNDNINRTPICVKVVSEDGNTVRQVLKALGAYGPNTTEWNTSLRNKTLADGDALTASYTTVAGDRLVIEVGGQVDATGGTSVTGTMSFGSDSATDLGENETDTAANNPWFEISRTLTFNPVSLAGTGRATPPLGVTLGLILTIAIGAARTTPPRSLPVPALQPTVSLSGTSRLVSPVSRGAAVTQTTPLAGADRTGAARGTGLVVQSQPLAGTARQTAPRSLGFLGQPLPLAGSDRVGAPRALGAALTQTQPIAGTGRATSPRSLAAALTQLQPLGGTGRQTMPRATGALSFAGGPTADLSGTSRMTSPRGRTTSLTIVIAVGPARMSAPRATGDLDTLQVVYTAETRMTSPRSLGAALTFAGAFQCTDRTAPPRALGASLTQLKPLTGTDRQVSPRATGQLTQTTPLAGTGRQTAPRGIGTLSFATPGTIDLAGTARTTSPRGFAAALTQSQPLAGVDRQTPPRDAGQVSQTQPLSGAQFAYRSLSASGALYRSQSASGPLYRGKKGVP